MKKYLLLLLAVGFLVSCDQKQVIETEILPENSNCYDAPRIGFDFELGIWWCEDDPQNWHFFNEIFSASYHPDERRFFAPEIQITSEVLAFCCEAEDYNVTIFQEMEDCEAANDSPFLSECNDQDSNGCTRTLTFRNTEYFGECNHVTQWVEGLQTKEPYDWCQ